MMRVFMLSFFFLLFINSQVSEDWEYSSHYTVIDQVFYRLAFVTQLGSANNFTHIIRIFDAVIESIKIPAIRSKLAEQRPVYLVGDSARDFAEFVTAFDNTTGEYVLDKAGFSTNKPLPGFLSSDFEGCSHEHAFEDVPVHEFMHTIHLDGFDDVMKSQLNGLYEEAMVSPYRTYDTTSYAFQNVMEFFAEMSQIFTGVTVRRDVTGGLDIHSLKAELPKMFAFLNSIFDVSTDCVKQASCALPCAKHLWVRCATNLTNPVESELPEY